MHHGGLSRIIYDTWCIMVHLGFSWWLEVDTAGIGIKDGSGNDDVSKEIEDKSQIEGLQGDNDNVENKEREGKHEDAIEMNDDFGGDLEDIPDADSERNAESYANDEPALDKTLESLDDLDTSAVDEKCGVTRRDRKTQETLRTRQTKNIWKSKMILLKQ